jgi:hypothetical protein
MIAYFCIFMIQDFHIIFFETPTSSKRWRLPTGAAKLKSRSRRVGKPSSAHLLKGTPAIRLACL